MNCAIYEGSRKTDHYLYVAEENDFSQVPPALLGMLGKLKLVMTLDLGPNRKLKQADVHQVREALRTQGYYFQMPAQTHKPSPIPSQ